MNTIEDAEKFVKENFKGLADFMSKDVFLFYKALIVSAITNYQPKQEAIESDAVEFAEWISRYGYGKGYGNERDTWFTFNDTVVANSTEKLYQLFKNNQ